jgi:PAS domain S-box-containing protein
MDEQLQLPARDAAPPAEARAGVDAPLVLLIEDNVDLNTFIADSLRPYYRVASARDGREGLERAMALQPDLIICDVVMPRLGGDRLVLELRRQPALVDVPIVMLTAKVDDELRVRLLRMGVDDCLDKPFAVEELLARLGGLIEKRRRTRAELQRFEHIVATSGDMLAFLDSQRRFLVANAAYAARFGLTPADLQQRHVEEVVGADNYSVIAPYLDRALNGQVQRFVAAPSFPDGKRVVLDAEYRPFVQNGSVHGVVVSLRDITELKAAEEAQRMQADELARRNAELERFNRATVGRELDMIALKRQVNDLSRQLGQAPPFAMVSPETADRPLPGANP